MKFYQDYELDNVNSDSLVVRYICNNLIQIAHTCIQSWKTLFILINLSNVCILFKPRVFLYSTSFRDYLYIFAFIFCCLYIHYSLVLSTLFLASGDLYFITTNILLTVPWRSFFCGSFMFFFLSCICYAFVHVCLHVPCGHLLGKG